MGRDWVSQPVGRGNLSPTETSFYDWVSIGIEQYRALNYGYASHKCQHALITPVIGTKRPQTRCYVEAIDQSVQLQTYQQKRKVTIEPILGLLKQLLSTHNNHKQLPVSGKPNVVTFLTLGVVLLQGAMLVNSIWGLPLRNVTHLITLFR